MRPTIPREFAPGHGPAHLGFDGRAPAVGMNQAQHSYNGLAEPACMLSSLQAPSQGSLIDEDTPIKELAPPKQVAQKCQFCHSEV